MTRHGEPDPRRLALDACWAALTDAGLNVDSIDGIVDYRMPGDSPNCLERTRMLGASDVAVYLDVAETGPSGLGGALAAVMAVASGARETALVYRSITRRSGHVASYTPTGELVGGMQQYLAPYGCVGGLLGSMAMKKRRRSQELDGRPEDYG